MVSDVKVGSYNNNKKIIVTEDGKAYEKAGLAASAGAVAAAGL